MTEIQAEIQQVEIQIQELEQTLDAISPNNVLYPGLLLELQELKDDLESVRSLATKFDL